MLDTKVFQEEFDEVQESFPESERLDYKSEERTDFTSQILKLGILILNALWALVPDAKNDRSWWPWWTNI